MPGPFGAVTRGDRAFSSPEPFPPTEHFRTTARMLVDEPDHQLGLVERTHSPTGTSVHVASGGRLVVLQGHCYDPVSREQHDAATLLAALDRSGDQVWSEAEGAFLFVVLDPVGRELRITNDRLGILPLYWHASEGRFCFAPALRYLPFGLPQNPYDPVSVIHLLAIGKYPGPHTPLRDVSLLQPAMHVTIDLDDPKPRFEHYWELEYRADKSAKPKDLAHDLADAIEQSMDLLTAPSAGRGGLFLSGGWDSRSVLGAWLACGRKPARAITNGMSDDIEWSDTWLARKMAHELGIPYYFSRREPRAGSELWREGLWLSEIASENSPGVFGIHRLPEDQFDGLDYMVKGDVTWGTGELTSTEEGVVDRNFPWPLGDNVLSCLAPDLRGEATVLYRDAIEATLARCRNDHPADRQQWLWQMSGIFRYIFSHGYYDEEYIEVRRPLLTRLVLDQWTRVPWRLRVQKSLFLETIAKRYPSLFSYGRNHASHLANYYAHMSHRVRSTTEELEDPHGHVSEVLELDRIRDLLTSFDPSSSPPRSRFSTKQRLRNWLHDRHAWRYHRTKFYEPEMRSLTTSDHSLAFRAHLLARWRSVSRP